MDSKRPSEKESVSGDLKLDHLSKGVGTTESILDNTLTCFQELERLVELKFGDGSPDVIRCIRECKTRIMTVCGEMDEVETCISSVVKDVNQTGLIHLPPFRPPLSQHLHVPVSKKRKMSLE